ncbi:hypothetical protein FisN_UnNu084 [Fistulifera solaris]|uniref:Uncharacterized protein n=1 Tax=Fistulifera solaris TaxID=1519565 RepID=A0A1Z5JUF4_FISSO|nr:hypothetical protein FisN_UnNu084 [Fistulifera solaris]|eukprot:GAX17650.1 hypothetical protein FisN_UnNu084 [Fistulifera solaris]
MAKREGPKDKEGNLWIKSKAKKQLVNDLVSGHVPIDSTKMSAEEVYNLSDRRELFQQFAFKNFSPNLKRLRKEHLELYASAAADEDALRRDRTVFPKQVIDRRGKPVWDGSEAQRLLRCDVRAKLDESLGFKKLYLSNLAYQVFDRSTFRQHIGQEKRRELFIAYLKSKKLKKSKKSKK